METWMTSLEDQPEGKCFVVVLVSGLAGSSDVQSLEASWRFLGCGGSLAGHSKAPSTASMGCCCCVMIVLSLR